MFPDSEPLVESIGPGTVTRMGTSMSSSEASPSASPKFIRMSRTALPSSSERQLMRKSSPSSLNESRIALSCSRSANGKPA